MQTLRDRFKEFRRVKKPRKATASTPQQPLLVPSKKSPGITRPIESPLVPAGEDKVSFERHNNVLKSEWKKRRPNLVVVDELMEQSFAMRWDDLHSNVLDLETIFNKYPFLQSSIQVSCYKLTCLRQIWV